MAYSIVFIKDFRCKTEKTAMYAGFEIKNPKGLTIEDDCSIGPGTIRCL